MTTDRGGRHGCFGSALHLYFGYGSNMSRARLEARLGRCVVRGIAVVRGYRMLFDKRSVDGSGKCNIEATRRPTDVVHGVAYEVSESQLHALDGIEGAGYDNHLVDVVLGPETIRAHAYVAVSSARTSGLVPYDWYLAYVLGGAREHRLPAAYVDWLAAHPHAADPDGDRRRRNGRA